jgi:hypothetical protein
VQPDAGGDDIVGGLWQCLPVSRRRCREDFQPNGARRVQRAFITFDYDNDARLKDLLIGQSKNPDSAFGVHDWSIKTASPTWREEARRRIRASGLVIVLCGKYTHLATGVGVELGIAQAEGVDYFLLAGYKEGSTRATTARATDKMYDWTWENLKKLVNGAR